MCTAQVQAKSKFDNNNQADEFRCFMKVDLCTVSRMDCSGQKKY